MNCKEGYASIQVGGRTIRAYCIQSAKELFEIRNALNDNGTFSNNYDNAYVLTDDIVLDNDNNEEIATWTPIGNEKHPFRGIIFGNGKTITLKMTIEPTKYMGLFGLTQNSHIEHLSVKYAQNASEQGGAASVIPYRLPGEEVYFGGLSGQITDSTIDNVDVEFPNTEIIYEGENSHKGIFHFGTFFGLTQNTTLNIIQIHASGTAIDLSERAKEMTFNNVKACNVEIDNIADLFKDYDVKVGSVVGNSENDVITNVEVVSDLHVRNGQRIFVGGAIGYAKGLTLDNIALNVTVEGQNDWFEKTYEDTYSSAVGGLIGYANNIKRIKNISQIQYDDESSVIAVTGYVNVGGLIGKLKQDALYGEISNSDINHPLSIHVTAALRSVGGLIGSIYFTPAAVKDSEVLSIDHFNFENVTIQMIPDDALNAKPGYVQETICEADNESKNFRRYIGGIAGITSNKERADLLHFSNITLNNHIFDSSGMNCHADDEEVKFSAMVGGFGGMLLHSSLSNIELGGYTQIVNEKCPSFVSHIGGFIGSEKHCDYNSVHLSNIQINLPNTTAVTALGGLMGYSDSSKISSCSIEDASISVNDGNKIGGIVGDSKSITIENCQVTDIEMQAKTAESVGLVAGHTTQARISDINVIKTDEKDNLLFVGKGTKIGGITGNSENSTFENFEITSTQIQTSNAEYVGLVCGYANKARLSNTTLSNVNITIDGTDSTQSTTSVGGMLGYAADSNLSVCNIDNLAILIQNNNDALGKGIGGVLGDASSTSVDRCFIRHTSVRAPKTNNVGLITGNANTVKVSKTTVTDSSVSGQQAVGGFVGNCQGCQISSCSPAMAEHGADTSSCMTTQKVEVDGSGTGIGGLIGNASADLNTPPNISQVSLDSITVRNVSTGNAGGLIGDASTINLDNVHIERSTVSNNKGDKLSSTGGVIGSLRNTASVRNVYLSNNQIIGNHDQGYMGSLVGAAGMSKSISIFDSILIVNHTTTGEKGYIGGFFGSLTSTNVELRRASIFVNLIDKTDGSINGVGGIAGAVGDSNLSLQDVSLIAALDSEDTKDGKIGELIGDYAQSQTGQKISAFNLYSLVRRDTFTLPLVGEMAIRENYSTDVFDFTQYYRLDNRTEIPYTCNACLTPSDDKCECRELPEQFITNACLNACDAPIDSSVFNADKCICGNIKGSELELEPTSDFIEISKDGDGSFSCMLSENPTDNEATGCKNTNAVDSEGVCLANISSSTPFHPGPIVPSIELPKCRDYDIWHDYSCKLPVLMECEAVTHSTEEVLLFLCNGEKCCGNVNLPLPFDKTNMPEGCDS